MARPKKQTVDYFSHDTDASDGKTITILQNKYGNDGYAFWFKLLEILGKAPGHVYVFNNDADWEFLLAKTHISDSETARNILETLSNLGAIDNELHEQGYIWCQNFVNRLADVYKRRSEKVPEKPILGVNDNNKPVSVNNNFVSDNDNPQSKVNKSKVNKSSSTTTSDNQLEEKQRTDDMAEIAQLYESDIGRISSTIAQELNDAFETYPAEDIKDAIKEAVKNGVCKWSYIKAILERWAREGRAAKGKKSDPDKYIKGKYGHLVNR